MPLALLAVWALLLLAHASHAQMISDVRIRTIAGTGIKGYSGDGGPASVALLNYPTDVSQCFLSGAVAIADSQNCRVRLVSPMGTMSTLAGTGASIAGTSALNEGGQATSTMLNEPFAVAFVANVASKLLVSDIVQVSSASSRIRLVTMSTGVITLVAGTGAFATTGNGGPATSAQLEMPQGLTTDVTGTKAWAADSWPSPGQVRAITIGGSISLTASTSLVSPVSVAYDSSTGALYISDNDASTTCVFKQKVPGGALARYAGTGLAGYSGDGGPATLAALNLPMGLALDPLTGNLYIADNYNHVIRCVLAANGTIITVAGGGSNFAATNIGDRGPALGASIVYPQAVSFNPYTQVLVIGQSFNFRVRATYPWGLTVAAASAGPSVASFSGWASLYDTPLEAAVAPPGCFWDNAVATAPQAQAAANGVTFFLAMPPATSGPAVGAPLPTVPCASVAISRPPAVSPLHTCEKIANVTCWLACPIDGGTGWQLAMSQSNGTGAAFTLSQRTGPSVSAPLQLLAATVAVSPAGVGGVGACAGVGACTATLSITGANLGWNLGLAARGAVSLLWAGSPAACSPPAVTSASVLTATCDARKALTALFWAPYPAVVVVGNAAASVSVPLQAGLPVVSVAPAVAALGDVLNISALGIGAAQPLAVNVSIDFSPSNTLPCIHLNAPSADLLQCTLRFAMTAWVGRLLSLAVAFNGPAGVSVVPIPASALNLTFAAPVVLAVSVPAWVAGAQGAIVSITMPQPQWTVAELLAAGFDISSGALLAVRAWVGPTSLGTCTYASSTTVECITPPGVLFVGTVCLEAGHLLNASTASLTVSSSIAIAPQQITWGDNITVTAAGIGTLMGRVSGAVLSLIALPASTAGGAAPCLVTILSGTDAVICSLRIAASSLASYPGSLGVSIAVDIAGPGRAVAVTASFAVGVTFVHPTLLNATVNAWSAATNPAAVDFWLPELPWLAADLAAGGLPVNPVTLGVRGWIGTMVMTCSFDSGATSHVLCIAATGTSLGESTVVELGGMLNLTAAFIHVTAPASLYPPQVTWGDQLQINSNLIGQRLPETMKIVTDTNFLDAALPCVGAAVKSGSSEGVVYCTLRFYSSSWVVSSSASEWPLVGIVFTGQSLLHLSSAVTRGVFSAVLFSNVTSQAPMLQREGGTTITMTLPQPAWTVTEANVSAVPIAVAVDANKLRGWLGASAMSVCNVVPGGTLVTCVAPAGDSPAVAATLELGGIVNITSASTVPPLSYAPPPIVGAVPFGILLPPYATRGTPVYSSFYIEGSGFISGWAAMSTQLFVGGQSCGTLQLINDTTFECLLWNASSFVDAAAASAIAGATSLPPTLDISLSFRWSGAVRVSVQQLQLGYVRPVVTRVVPANVQSGAAIVVSGSNLCPPFVCSNGAGSIPAGVSVFLGAVPCASVEVSSANSISCIVPPLSSGTPGYPEAFVTVVSSLGSTSLESVAVTYPIVPVIVFQGELPTTYVPSDISDPWPISGHIRFAVAGAAANVTVTSSTCSLLLSTPLAQLGSSILPTLVDVAGVNNSFDFQGVFVTAPFSVRSVSLSITCTYVQGISTGSTPPLLWSMSAVQLQTVACGRPAPEVSSQATLPPFGVAVTTVPAFGASLNVSADSVCRSEAALALPSVSCTVSMATSSLLDANTSQVAFLSGVSATVPPTSHIAQFNSFSIAGVHGATYLLEVRCAIGSVQIPGVSWYNVSISGCNAGFQPVGVVCAKCGDAQFSDGGTQVCQACPPAGISCVGGIATALTGFYRPPSQAALPLEANSLLFACPVPSTCNVVNGSVWVCSTGTGGPLCAVCDESVGYALFGGVCAQCWQPASSAALLAGIIVAFLVLTAFVALSSRSKIVNARASTDQGLQASNIKVPTSTEQGGDSRVAASSSLRILLGFVQAIGSLRAFRSSSLTAYDNIMGWTDAVSASILSLGPIQCLFRFSYLTQLLVTVSLPLIATLAIVCVFVLFIFVQSVHLRDVKVLASSKRNLVTATAGATAPTGSRCSALSLSTMALVRLKTTRFSSRLLAWYGTRMHVASLVFLLQLMYMPCVSVAIRALDCTVPIDGRQYLRADMRTACTGAEYYSLMTAAVIVLVVYGVGFPAAVLWVISRASQEQLDSPSFHAAWGFLYDGYRRGSRSTMAHGNDAIACSKAETGLQVAASYPPALTTRLLLVAVAFASAARRVLREDTLVAWEGLVLLRKAGLVLVSLLVTDPQLQAVIAILWVLTFFSLHLAFRPYESRRHNLMETAALAAVLVTAVLSVALAESSSGTAGTPASSSGLSQLGLTVALVLLNCTVIAGLAAAWLPLQLRLLAANFARFNGAVRRPTRQQAPHPLAQPVRPLPVRFNFNPPAPPGGDEAKSTSLVRRPSSAVVGIELPAMTVLHSPRMQLTRASSSSTVGDGDEGPSSFQNPFSQTPARLNSHSSVAATGSVSSRFLVTKGDATAASVSQSRVLAQTVRRAIPLPAASPPAAVAPLSNGPAIESADALQVRRAFPPRAAVQRR